MTRNQDALFALEIELGNDAMLNGEDIADALERVAQDIREDLTEHGTIRDLNGNAVGYWTTT